MKSIFSAFKSIFKKIWSLISKLIKSNDSDDDDDTTGGQPYVVYYGCPNGKKADALRTKEKAITK